MFFLSALLVQVTTILTMTPAMTLFAWAASADIQRVVSSWPFVVQFIAILFLTDFVQHWVHRAFHRVPILWRFHRIHHSADVMDWLAGSRLHLVDVAVTRGLTYVPIYLLGFSEPPLYAHVAFVSVQATFIHANVRFRFGPCAGCWPRRSSTIGTTARSPRPWTRTSQCTCRCWIACSGPATSPGTDGPPRMVWPMARPFRAATCVSWSIRSFRNSRFDPNPRHPATVT